MLVVKNLSVSFNGKKGGRGLKDISITANRGEFCMLVGRNGSGKTTLLESIAGYHRLSSGAIYVGDSNLTHMKPFKRTEYLNLIYHDVGVGFPDRLTLGEVLALWADRQKAAFGLLRWRDKRVTLLATLKQYLPYLETRADDQIATLSGGERQLLSLACLSARFASCAPQNFALLLDEHTANLDAIFAVQVMEESRSLIQRYQIAALAVTHSLSLASRFADRLFLLENGGIPLELDLRESSRKTRDDVMLQLEDRLGQHAHPSELDY